MFGSEHLRISLIIAVLFLISCGSSTTRDYDINIHTGTQGVSMNFYSNAPPAEVAQGRRVPIEIVVQNFGAHDVSRGVLVLMSDQSSIFFEETPEIPLFLKGKSKSLPSGEMKTISLNAKAGMLHFQQSYRDTILTAAMCYAYETETTAIVCIDTEKHGVREQAKSCQMGPVSMGQGQGGPVGVIQVVPDVFPSVDAEDRVIAVFDIYLRNFGSGLVTNYQYANQACAGGVDETNIIDLDAYLSDIPLICDANRVQLRPNGETRIRCETPERPGITIRLGAYTAPLSINLRYGYQEIQSRSIRIVP